MKATFAPLLPFVAASLGGAPANVVAQEYCYPSPPVYYEVSPGGYYESEPYVAVEYGEPIYRALPYLPAEPDPESGQRDAIHRIAPPSPSELRAKIHHHIFSRFGIVSGNESHTPVAQVPPPPPEIPAPTYGFRQPIPAQNVNPDYRRPVPQPQHRSGSPLRSDYVVVPETAPTRQALPEQPAWVAEAERRLRQPDRSTVRRPETPAVQSPTTMPAPSEQADTVEPPTPDAPPFAKPVPGKDGFVYSPFDGTDKLVDVRDMAPGTEVRDPYTGGIFRVP